MAVGPRNPAIAMLASGLLLALVTGLAGVSWQWRKAEANLSAAQVANRKAQARFDLAMEAVKAFTTGASEDVLLREVTRGASPAATRWLAFVLQPPGRLPGRGDNRASRRSLAQAVYDAAELDGRIGRQEEAVTAHLEVIGLRQGLLREAPGDATVRRELARSELALSEPLHALGPHVEARQALGCSRAIADGLLRERPGDSDAQGVPCRSVPGRRTWVDDPGLAGRCQCLLERARGLRALARRDAIGQPVSDRA